ncbi:DUF3616 domain-containing protein [Geminicoccaceae bacterium 1502E]|nr:DUF3616 domain-containing protein [Geminicoccaceae bacterium 1502E]
MAGRGGTRAAKRLEKPERLWLSFLDEGDQARDDEPVATDLSAAAAAGRDLWVANDELAHVERLSRNEKGFGAHTPFALADFLELPGGPMGEMDIEGLDVDGGYLWIAGSYSSTRRKPKTGENDAAEVLERLCDVRDDPNRYVLARVPIEQAPDGSTRLVREVSLEHGHRRSAAILPVKDGRNKLLRELAKDEHLGPFIGLPAKENGFDVEGLAVRGERVFLGLRGPVLRGWAIILELSVKESGPGCLKLRKHGPGGMRYRKHFLDLDGLGIRELCWHGQDLLILAGPTMDLDGPNRLLRWKAPLETDEPQVLTRDRLTHVAELPTVRGADHPEGLAILPGGDGEADRLLVIHDSPAPERLGDGKRCIAADLLSLG